MRQLATAFLAATLILATDGSQVSAQEDAQSFELSLFSPVQIRSPDADIRILRLSLLYGRNVSVRGLDVGLVMRNTGGESVGLQYGLVGLVGGDFKGWQNTFANVVDGRFAGFQSGVYNGMGTGEAFQLGWVNRAEQVSGFQLGLVNLADNMNGLQVGLVNVIRSKPSLAFLPIVNWSF